MDEEYQAVTKELDSILDGLPGKIIAIDGRDGSGKTTLGRYLAYKYNISLIETDLFLTEDQTSLNYYEDQIKRIIKKRLSIPRPVVVEGVAVLELVEKLGIAKDYLIYVISNEFEGSHGLNALLTTYEAKHKCRYHPEVKSLMQLTSQSTTRRRRRTQQSCAGY